MKETFEVWDNFIKEQKYRENRSVLMKAIFKARQPDEIVLRPRRTIYVRHPTIAHKKIPLFRKGEYYEGHFYGGNRITIEVERRDWLGNCYNSSMTYGYEWVDSKEKKFFRQDADTDKEITYIKVPWNKCDREARGVAKIHMDKDMLVNIIEAAAEGTSERKIRGILGNDSMVTTKGSGAQLVPIIGKRRPKIANWLRRFYGGRHIFSITLNNSPLSEVLWFIQGEAQRASSRGRKIKIYISRGLNIKKGISIDLKDVTPGVGLYKILQLAKIKFRVDKHKRIQLGAVGPWLPLAEALTTWYDQDPTSWAGGDGDPEAGAAEAEKARAAQTAGFKKANKGRAGQKPSQKEKESQYNDIIKAAAREYRVGPNLIKAIIKVESNFNPQKVGTGGGQKGLMQLHPELIEFLKTAPGLGFPFSDPMDPRQNIMAGAKYLQMLLRVFKKNIDLVLGAWHTDPAVIKKGCKDENKEFVICSKIGKVGALPSEEVKNWVNGVKHVRSRYKFEHRGR